MATDDPDGVMIFAPVPQLTVTIEEAASGVELHVHAGSQGIWQARMCAALGAPVTLCAAVGGEIGDVIAGVLAAEEISLRLIHRDEGSGWYVHDRRDGSRSTIAEHAGQPLGRHDADELYTAALAAGLRSRVSVLSGPAAPGVVHPSLYRRLASDLRKHGVQVVADLSGELLAAVLAAGVSFLKVSHDELIDAQRAADDSEAALAEAARKLRADGADRVLISRAGQPALALVDDDLLTVELPALEVVDHRGAGDSMTAGVAAVLARGGDAREAIRTGAAAGALNVTRHGLGTGHSDAVVELARRARLATV
ncbi:1-phosphofructokinase family hexose kinase [Actinoplanes siamensis]|nr:PfkB family carbohydrate kinase [Actinoplanes siamensis]